jgi:hypothetical protein
LQHNLALDPSTRFINIECQDILIYPDEIESGLHLIPADIPIPSSATVEVDIRHESGKSLARIVKFVDKPQPSVRSNLGTDAIAGPLSFLGYDLNKTSTSPKAYNQSPPLVFTTYWQVQNVPDRPISLMAHLIDPSGKPIAVGDAMDYPLSQWRIGDLLIQTHRLEMESTISRNTVLRLATGGYWLDTMERWPIEEESNQNDMIVLQELKIDR